MDGIMIDSGSTFTYLTSKEYSVFVSAFTVQLKKNMAAANKPVQSVTRPRVSLLLSFNHSIIQLFNYSIIQSCIGA